MKWNLTASLNGLGKLVIIATMYFGRVGPISLAACLQLDACIPNFLVQEHPVTPDGAELGHGFIKEPFVIKEGFIDTPTKPGLGVELDEEAMREREYDGKWTTPRQYYEDGSIAEW